MIFAVLVATKMGMLEGVFSFGGVDESWRRPIETDCLLFDDFSVGGLLGEDLIGEVVSWRSQDAIL